MRCRPTSWLVRGPLVALAATTAYGVVAVALQVPLSVVNAADGDLAGPGVQQPGRPPHTAGGLTRGRDRRHRREA